MKSPKKLFKQLSFAILLLLCITVKSQTCGTCTINVTTRDTNSYTIGTGQTMCIDSTGRFFGKITLNGGTLCNRGICNLKQLTFNSGSIVNKSIMTYPGGLTITSGKSLDNTKKGILQVEEDVVVNGGSLVNAGIINVMLDLTNTTGSFDNRKVINCRAVSGSTVFVNRGIINSR